MIRVGLVGYGLAGSVFHAPLIRAAKRLELAAVMTSRDVAGAVRDLGALLERSASSSSLPRTRPTSRSPRRHWRPAGTSSWTSRSPPPPPRRRR